MEPYLLLTTSYEIQKVKDRLAKLDLIQPLTTESRVIRQELSTRLERLKKLEVLNPRVGNCEECGRLFGELELKQTCKYTDCGGRIVCLGCLPLAGVKCQGCQLPLCDPCAPLSPPGFCDKECESAF